MKASTLFGYNDCEWAVLDLIFRLHLYLGVLPAPQGGQVLLDEPSVSRLQSNDVERYLEPVTTNLDAETGYMTYQSVSGMFEPIHVMVTCLTITQVRSC